MRLTIDDQTKQITNVQAVERAQDPGWTPTFRILNIAGGPIYPAPAFTGDRDIWDFNAYPGEESPISDIRVEKRHPNTVIAGVPNSEKVLVDGLIKFRAGSHTDRIGTGPTVQCPFHVPWVWCETVVTYDGNQFKLYGRGSIFPTHCWYLNGIKVNTAAQVGDSNFPFADLSLWGSKFPNPIEIRYTALKLYPVLSKGAPAEGPQTSLDADKGRSGPVDTHPFTVSGGDPFTFP